MNHLTWLRRTIVLPDSNLIDSGNAEQLRDVQTHVDSQLATIIVHLRTLNIDKQQTAEKFASKLLAPDQTSSDSSAALQTRSSSSEESSEGENTEKKPISDLKYPASGAATRSTWQKITLADLPHVAWYVTRLSQSEMDDINKEEIPELVDRVRLEWPSRMAEVFPGGYDGMMVKTMRERVINRLRLDKDELRALMVTTGRESKKTKIIDYINKVKPGMIIAG